MKGIGTRRRGGAALITAVVFIFFLTLFGLAFYQLGDTDIDLFGYKKNLSKALYASEAGIDKVRWMIRESHQISGANPFSSAYVEANAISIANPTGGDFFPGQTDKPYFKVCMIQAAGSKVRVQTLGAVDVDADGEAGLTASEDGFTLDPDDVNRKFEARIGLPGTLGETIRGKGISAAATTFSGESGPHSDGRLFVTPDGDSMNGFLYFGDSPTPWGSIWTRWEFIFSDPVKSGEIELPPGIFDASGDYIDEDAIPVPDYFQDLDWRRYSGDNTFEPLNDPTAGADGRSVIYVDGHITIKNVDFGHLNDQGEIKNSDWEKTDLTFIADGDITVRRVDCGNVGRLVLVGKNIILEGDYNTKVNGIAIASNDIILDGSGCTYGILTNQTDYTRPVRYAAYFLGTMVAGNQINLQDGGWTVIYDENVINGSMYSPTLPPKPTLTYERVEADDFNTTNNWDLNGDELLRTQENYLPEDIGEADSSDLGTDEDPELMRMFLQPIWHAADDDHDFPISDGVYCDFTDVGNVFADSDINIGPQDWENYTTIHFWMALDNWEKVFGSKMTLRKSSFQVLLYDTGANTLTLNLSYPNNDWVAEPGNVHWELFRITPQLIDPLSNFDIGNVSRIEFYYDNIFVNWYINDTDREWIAYDKTDTTGYGSDGYYYYMKFNGTDHDKYPVQFKPPDANGRRQLYYEDPPGTINDIEWNWDPGSSIFEYMYFEDTADPQKSALNSFLKVDRLEVPGKPAANTYLEYGLPHSLRLEVTNWREL